jgi:hypothetical protein
VLARATAVSQLVLACSSATIALSRM